MTILTTTEELANFCATLAETEFVTVDTEFMRERTYWPRLCLVQLGAPTDTVAIDPLSTDINLAPLMALLAAPNVLKVFHAARQDIEIFYNISGKVPFPLFDTQVAAMVCGFGEAASYETLATQLAGAKIDKSSRFTDWANRPLTEHQIAYALADVSHLRTVYAKLRNRLEQTGRAAWLSEEMAILTNPKTYSVEPSEIWRRFKWRAEKPRLRALLRELAAWREREAQRLNIPRGRIMRDETLMEIAHHPPRVLRDLNKVRGISSGIVESRQGADILAAVMRAEKLPVEQCPAGEEKPTAPPGIGPVIDLLKLLLKHTAECQGVAGKLVATSDELEQIAADDYANVMALKGWRREIFGDQALALKRGQLAIRCNGKRLELVPVSVPCEITAQN